MTALHSNVKLHLVDALFVGDEYRTYVWISEHALKKLNRARNRHHETINVFLGKVSHWAKAGFDEFVGKKPYPIRPEGQGVFRLGERRNLFRALGFFHNESTFIWIDFYLKRGQDADGDAISEVARVKRLGAWEFNDEPE